MYIPKKYGQSKIDKCPFCDKSSTIMNSQKVPVCTAHMEETLDNLKCVCGETLDILHGKFGVFFSCMKCGNMNMKKMMEINTIKPRKQFNETDNPKISNENKPYYSSKTTNSSGKTTTTVRSDDPRYFD
ncbi:MAG: hypothetical protein AABX00_06360 [Nanoarchaeota archaeon]